MGAAITKKPTGKLYIVTPSGEKSRAVSGLPRVDGRGQGGLLDVEVGPDFAQSGRIPEGRAQARDLGSHFGKVVRILPDGSVPTDNPFVGRSGAEPEIWSLGHATSSPPRSMIELGSGSSKWGRAAATSSTSWPRAKTTAGPRSDTARNIRVSPSILKRRSPASSNPSTLGTR